MDKRIVAFGILGAVFVGVFACWQLLAFRMSGDFVDALRNGSVNDTLPLDLHGKTWTEAELGTVEVIRLSQGAGKEQALQRHIHTGGGHTLSPRLYAYQATITDAATGYKHVFGYHRAEGRGWCYAELHRDSARQRVQQRLDTGEWPTRPGYPR